MASSDPPSIPPNGNPITGIFRSRKTIIVLATLLCATLLAALGRISGESALQLMTFVIPSWLLGISYEDGRAKGARSQVVNMSAAPADPAAIAHAFETSLAATRKPTFPTTFGSETHGQ
jgi:hypothetical protein